MYVICPPLIKLLISSLRQFQVPSSKFQTLKYKLKVEDLPTLSLKGIVKS